jgi:hypothetical protein
MKILLAILLSIGIAISPAVAAPRYTAAKQAAEKLRKDERELAKRIKKLSSSERAKLKAALARGTDSDADGLTDILEGAIGTNRCDADSDDDGVDDSDDGAENDGSSSGDDDSSGGSNPGDDSNPPGEIEVKGTISSFDGSVLRVKGESFVVNSDTIFRGQGFGKDDLEAGLCVEVKGRRTADTVIAIRIQRESAGECQ